MIRVATINITRPADASDYAVGDRIWNSTSTTGITSSASVFSNLGETMFGNGYVVKASIFTDNTVVSGSTLRLHLYTLSSGQTLATGATVVDNSALVLSFADASKYVGYIDFSTWVTGTNFAYSVVNTSIAFQRGSIRGESDFTGYGTAPNQVRVGTLVGILETRSAIVAPGSGQQFQIELVSDAQEGVSPP